VRTRGWGGNPPATDAEAADRIVAAARRCLDSRGSTTTITYIAAELRVARPTVYRYFDNLEDLLRAVALVAADELGDRIAAHVTTFATPSTEERIVEAVAYLIETMPEEAYYGLLFTTAWSNRSFKEVTSPVAMMAGRELLRRLTIDRADLGLDDPTMDELVEHLLRTVQSFLLDPGEPPRRGPELRRYLRRWLWGPVRALADDSAVGVR
jgi:AcrR family transcriptional regulator